MISLRFLGAAQNVTGSRTLVEAPEGRFLIDCGLVQERDRQDRNWEPFPIAPSLVDSAFLTHAHLDHCGLLPRFVAQGFRGPIYATSATAELATVVMEDSARLQAEDAAFKAKRHAKEGRDSPRPPKPLYTPEEVDRVGERFRPAAYGERLRLVGGAEAELREAGHVLGSSMVSLRVGGRRILFTGDVGRVDRPIVRDAAPPPEADFVVIESTYGDRTHPLEGDLEGAFAEILLDTLRRGGNVVVPIFAIERAQEVLFHLGRLRTAGRIPPLPIFLDSPMAIQATAVFRRHAELYDEEMAALVRRGQSPFDLPGLKLVRTAESSMAINQIRGTAIILAGAGMCTGGRVKHHLVHNLGRPESTVLFVGYQAPGTLGRQILDGAPMVRLFNRPFPVRARVARLTGFSGHADRDELLAWLRQLPRPPQKVFVTHGEPAAATGFAETIRRETGWEAMAPAYGETVPL